MTMSFGSLYGVEEQQVPESNWMDCRKQFYSPPCFCPPCAMMDSCYKFNFYTQCS